MDLVKDQVQEILTRLVCANGAFISATDPSIVEATSEVSGLFENCKIDYPPSPSQSLPSQTSPFLTKLPAEVRKSIFQYAFANSVMLIDGFRDPIDCEVCGIIEPSKDTIIHPTLKCRRPDAHLRFQGPASYGVLLACRGMYLEARHILASNLKVYIGIRYVRTLKVLLRSRGQHPFLQFAAEHVQHVYSTLYSGYPPRELATFFPSIKCLEYGPDCKLCEYLPFTVEIVSNGGHHDLIGMWAEKMYSYLWEDTKTWKRRSVAYERHIHLGVRLLDFKYCVSVRIAPVCLFAV